MNKEELIKDLKEERAENLDNIFHKSLLDMPLIFALVIDVRCINKLIKKLEEKE